MRDAALADQRAKLLRPTRPRSRLPSGRLAHPEVTEVFYGDSSNNVARCSREWPGGRTNQSRSAIRHRGAVPVDRVSCWAPP
jgi:hypothetical protein